MEQKEENRKQIFEARIVIPFETLSERTRIELNILVCETSLKAAKEKAEEWAKKYLETNGKAIRERIGTSTPSRDIRVQVFKTSYCAFI
jgi:hypothetical protein